MPQEKRSGGKDSGHSDRLFAEFQPATPDDWRREAKRLLKGAEIEERLVTDTHEGLSLYPIYGEDETRGLSHVETCPGAAPFVRGSRPIRGRGAEWVIAQEQRSRSAGGANRLARNDLAREGGAVNVTVDSGGGGGVPIADLGQMARLLEGIDLTLVPVYLHVGAEGLSILGLFAAHARGAGLAPESLSGAIANDPLGALGVDGMIPMSLKSALDEMAEATSWAAARAPRLGTVWIHGEIYHDGGGSAVQELAFSLATAVAYLRALDARGLRPEKTAPHFRFSAALGSHFFMEVSKLRAARLLWNRVLEACDVPQEKRTLWVHGSTSRHGATRCDPHVNMLRATTQTLAGVVGGADSLHTAPFDDATGGSDDFSRRIALNTQLILRDESHLAGVVDPAGGSWYVEKLTDEIAHAAWSLFQDVEKQGGMAQALADGFVQSSLKKTAGEKRTAAARGVDVIVGTNKYPLRGEADLGSPAAAERPPSAERPPGDRPSPAKEDAVGDDAVGDDAACHDVCDTLIAAAARGATVEEMSRSLATRNGSKAERVSPLVAGRRAEPFESLRAAVEDHRARGRNARVFIATLGNVARSMARVDFAASFFEVGGFEVVRAEGGLSPERTAESVLESAAPVVVLCGLDEDYERNAVSIARRLKEADSAPLIALAGRPAESARADEYGAAGVDLFIHLRSDRLDVLGRVARGMGVVL